MVAKFLDLNNSSWQRQESRTFHTIHVRFFLSNLQDQALLRSKSFITMATTCPLYRARSCITVILRAEFDATLRLREVIALASQENKNKKQNKLNCCSEQLFGVWDCRCLACVQTSPPSSGTNRERRRDLFLREEGTSVHRLAGVRLDSEEWKAQLRQVGMLALQLVLVDTTLQARQWHMIRQSNWLLNFVNFKKIPVFNR